MRGCGTELNGGGRRKAAAQAGLRGRRAFVLATVAHATPLRVKLASQVQFCSLMTWHWRLREEEGGEGEPGTFVEIDLGRLHSAEGLTPCPGCGKSMRKSQLAIHMRNKKCEEYADRLEEALPSVAPILGRVKCPMCAHVSPNLKALRKHYASQHGEKKQCSKCKKEYGRSDALRKHEKTCGACPLCAAFKRRF